MQKNVKSIVNSRHEKSIANSRHEKSIANSRHEKSKANSRQGLQSISDSSAAQDGRDECKTFATTEEDLEQDSADVPVAMHGQVPVLQKAQRTVEAPLVQYIDTIIDVPFVKRRQALPIQTVQKDVGSSSGSALVQQHRTQSRCPAAVH